MTYGYNKRLNLLSTGNHLVGTFMIDVDLDEIWQIAEVGISSGSALFAVLKSLFRDRNTIRTQDKSA